MVKKKVNHFNLLNTNLKEERNVCPVLKVGSITTPPPPRHPLSLGSSVIPPRGALSAGSFVKQLLVIYASLL